LGGRRKSERWGVAGGDRKRERATEGIREVIKVKDNKK
jgi:hypothetical protein